MDPGFPVGGGADPGGTSTYDLVKISEKLHEIEKFLDRREGAPLLRSTTDQDIIHQNLITATLKQGTPHGNLKS